MKGGTALNLFVFDVPRLSVDIGVNYVGAADRATMTAERPKLDAALEQDCGLARSVVGTMLRQQPRQALPANLRTANHRTQDMRITFRFFIIVCFLTAVGCSGDPADTPSEDVTVEDSGGSDASGADTEPPDDVAMDTTGADDTQDVVEDPSGADTQDDTMDASDADGSIEDAGDDDVAVDVGPDVDPEPPYTLIRDPGHTWSTEAQLEAFYSTYAPREDFPELHRVAFESMLVAHDAVVERDYDLADVAVEELVFARAPRSTSAWDSSPTVGFVGTNTGHPVAYYGLRMLEQIVAYGGGLEPSAPPLIMTAVVAPCANGRAPQPPGEDPIEALDVLIDPEILANDARRLYLSTDLFRRWLSAITDGVPVELQVYVLDDCSTVDFTDSEGTVISYPDADAMLDAVHPDVASLTDIWWVVTPSGIRNTEAELDRHTITGGMGLSRDGRPLLLSDDRWFVQKPDHLGTGMWTELELRTYHPQWFQHEFMHHLFHTWPEFGLEAAGHQWFDRATWPDDFVGQFEPDYYAEAIARRLRDATPSLAEGLDAPELLAVDAIGVDAILGRYERRPVENEYHEVTVERRDDSLVWQTAGSAFWSLQVTDGRLYSGPDCPYGENPIAIVGADGRVDRLMFFEPYHRVED